MHKTCCRVNMHLSFNRYMVECEYVKWVVDIKRVISF